MERNKRWGALALLAPLVMCLPCLLLPLAALGGAGILSAVGGVITGSLWLAMAVLLVGGGLAGAVYLRRRRADQTPDACCPMPANEPESPSRVQQTQP